MRKTVPPPRIPGIELLEEIGRGAHTVVYLARKDERRLAVKMLRESDGREDDALRFRREAALLACMQHPALPGILEIGDYRGRPYLVMDYIEGRTLAQVLLDGPLPQEAVVRIGRSLAGALAAVHARGFVHRDVKPENVVILPDGAARLLDFGLATRIREEGTPEGEVAGTFRYSAPEQTGMLKRPVDGRSDLYALGAVLFECAAGRPPFVARDVGELVRQHAVRAPPDLAELRPDVSPVLARIVARLLAKDPDDRYQAGRGLLADLERIGELESAGADAVLGSWDGAQAIFETPVVGCDLELDLLGECWRAATEGHGGAVLIEGPAGYGKSRTLRHVADEVRGGEALVLQARSTRGDPTPFGPLRDAIEGWLRRLKQMPPAARAAAEAQVVEAAGEMGPLLAGFSPALAALLPETTSPGEPGQDPFYNAIARFLVALAEAHGAALFLIDDAEWLDEASRQVIKRLVPKLADAHLLLVFAGCAGTEGLERLLADTANDLALRLPLRGLDRRGTEALIAHHLGGSKPDPQLVDAIATRAQGAPFAVIEYVAAMLDAGLLLPSWGSWRLEAGGLDAIALPADVTELIARRVDGLEPEVGEVLAAAAILGSRFGAEALPAVAGVAEADVEAALSRALKAHLLERGERNQYTFVHDRIRQALLAELSPEATRHLHLAAGAALAERRDPEGVYARARHLELGVGAPAEIWRANLDAGRLALAAHANEEACHFLEVARRAAAQAGVDEDAALVEALGTAAARAGRFAEGAAHLRRALALNREPLRRAALQAQLAELHLARLDTGEAWASIEQGFAELRRPYPNGGPGSWLITVALATVGTLLHALGLGWGDASPERRLGHALLVRLSNLGSRLGYLEGKRALHTQMTLVPLYSVHRLGPSRELAGAYAAQLRLVSAFGLRGLAEWLGRRAEAVASRLGERGLVARSLVARAMGRHMRGEAEGAVALHRRNLEENGHWLESGDYLAAVGDLALNLLGRGHVDAAWGWIRKGLKRAEEADGAEPGGHPLPAVGAALLAIQGKAAEGGALLQRQLGAEKAERWQRSMLLHGRLLFLLEQGETGGQLDEVIAAHRALGFSPATAPAQLRYFWAVQGWARLAQVRRGAGVELLEDAVEELRRAADTKVLRGHALVLGAALRAMEGDDEGALADLAKADALARAIDAPWITWEVLRNRARVLIASGSREVGMREAKLAFSFAVDLGWNARARAVAREFEIPVAQGGASRDVSVRSESGSAALLKLERQLAALLQVSRATASLLHPDEVANVALGEIARILGGERALLFLQGADGALERRAARCAADCDAGDLESYSRTAVQRAWETRAPLVVSSVEEEADLAARSVLTHDLRSIMAVPLVLRDSAIGVVYVDNRLARGMFGRDDVQILAALATLIATALETARAVQLELQRKELERDLERAFEAATTDALTGLKNRRFLEERMREELARARRSHQGLAAILLDVDRFKSVNDTWGHPVGDRVLVAVARAVAESARSTDVVARWGGEEFCVIASDTTAEGAMVLAERIREAIAAAEIPLEAGTEGPRVLRVTASLGVSTWIEGQDAEALIEAADEALYTAKEGGRNRAVLADATATRC